MSQNSQTLLPMLLQLFFGLRSLLQFKPNSCSVLLYIIELGTKLILHVLFFNFSYFWLVFLTEVNTTDSTKWGALAELPE